MQKEWETEVIAGKGRTLLSIYRDTLNTFRMSRRKEKVKKDQQVDEEGEKKVQEKWKKETKGNQAVGLDCRTAA